MASNKEIRPTWFYWDAREASSWEIIFFAAYLKKQHKGGDEGCEHRQTFPSISKLLFLLSICTLLFFLIFLRLPSWSDIFSADKEFEKNKITKKKVECYHCRYILPIPVYCIGRHLQKPTICEQNKIDYQYPAKLNCWDFKNHQFPEKRDVGTVKMVKIIVRRLRGNSGFIVV